MNILRKHWYDLGGALGLIVAGFVLSSHHSLSLYQLLMWVSLISLFLHQLEEYRIPGTFPGMINRVMYKSDLPDRYPLNTNTSLVINAGIGWTMYLLAALAGEKFIWLGMATILVSLGNFVAHTFIFNIKGKTIYNAGMATSWLFFAPCVFFFFKIIHEEHLATALDYLIGIPLGLLINTFGILKMISWLSDRNTSFTFRKNQLLREDRFSSSTAK